MTAHRPGSHLEANQRIAAAKIGCTVEEYREHRAAGRRWCSGCRRWRRGVTRSWCGQCRARSEARRRAARAVPAPPRSPRPAPARSLSRLCRWTDPASPWMYVVRVVVVQLGAWGRRG